MNKSAESQIARRITLLRKSAGVGIAEFSTATGIPSQALRSNGDLTIGNLATAANYFGITPTALTAGITG